MRIQEQYIVPGLGAAILLSVLGFVASGASNLFLLAMVVLGLAAVGTDLLPRGAQVEIRVAIAVLGMLFLPPYFSHLLFWLALLAFGGIGALQLRHGDTLQMLPQHTVAWVKGLLDQPAAETGARDEAAPDNGTQGLAGVSVLQGRLRVNVGGIGASLIGVFVVLSIFIMPWIGISFRGPSASGQVSYITLVEAAGWFRAAQGDWIPTLLLEVMAVLAIASATSVVLPRVASVIVSIAGLAGTMVVAVYLRNKYFDLWEPRREMDVYVDILTIAPLFVGQAFFAMLVLQLFPHLNRAKPRAAPPAEE